jgi:Flp pilus assembly pilin Flp
MMALFHHSTGLGARGQGLAEYALILALIAIVTILALTFLGTQISAILSYIGSAI